MKVGPTERIGLLSGVLPAAASGACAGVSGVAGAFVAVAGGAAPFFSAVGAGFAPGRCCIFFALSSVTMMSPCWAASAFSSIALSASDQVWPAALHAQAGLNELRN